VDAAQSDPSAIDGIALTLVGLLLAQSVFSFGRIVFFERVAQRSLASLRAAMYNHLVSLPLPFFHEKRIGELTNRLQSDIGVLQETFTSTLAEFIRQVVIIVGGIALLVYQSPSLTGFMLLVLPLVVLLGVFFGSKIRRYAKEVQTASAESNTVVDETLSAVATVKAYTQEGTEKARYRSALERVSALGIRGGILRGAFSSFIILGLFGALVAVIWKGASLIASGEMASGQLFSFVIYSGFIGGSVGGLADVYSRLQRAMGATEAIMAMLDEQPETSGQMPASADRTHRIDRRGRALCRRALCLPDASGRTGAARFEFNPSRRPAARLGGLQRRRQIHGGSIAVPLSRSPARPTFGAGPRRP
jgi:ABC-type bacteriocin/lantibiotic exporter with double-glycine peptidase domain